MENQEKEQVYLKLKTDNKVATMASAAEPSEDDSIKLDMANYSITSISLEQKCLLCDNTRVLPAYMSTHINPYICDECQQAIAYAKELMQRRGAELFYDQK